MLPTTLSKQFDRFAEEECRDYAPLYYQLSKQIAHDPQLLELCAWVKEGQPTPNSFLAAVHFLLLKNKDSELANYYPSITNQPEQTIPYDLFTTFVSEHEAEIKNLIQHRIVQTNVLTRCNYLAPVFSNLLHASNKPATIIDIGASAGLNLNFDRYEYHQNNRKIFGDSRVKLNCVVKQGQPEIKTIRTPIQKIGIDQNLIDLKNNDDLLWLQALVWPDQTERFTQLKAAVNDPALSDIILIKGSSIADFKSIVDAIDPGRTLILYATHVLYQFSDKLLQDFHAFLDQTGQTRDFYFLSAEATDWMRSKYNTSNTAVVLTTYKNHQKEEKLVAQTNGHGNWIIWNGV